MKGQIDFALGIAFGQVIGYAYLLDQARANIALGVAVGLAWARFLIWSYADPAPSSKPTPSAGRADA